MSRLLVVLGGGVQSDGKVPQWVDDRIIFAASRAGPSDTVLFSSIFSLNLPPKLDSDGYVISEAVQMAKRYVSLGGKGHVRVENASFDTVGSAVFSRLLFGHLVDSDDVIVVTSDFHQQRAEFIFNFVFDKVIPRLNVRSIKTIGMPTRKKFQNREVKEARALINIKEKFEDKLTLYQLIDWMVQHHSNYNLEFTSKSREAEYVEAY